MDSEDQNLFWFSKQVIETTPAEMSDSLTVYVAPTTAAQGSGPHYSYGPMDDKLIIFKNNAILSINGRARTTRALTIDIAPSLSFFTATVGYTESTKHFPLTPSGLMFSE